MPLSRPEKKKNTHTHARTRARASKLSVYTFCSFQQAQQQNKKVNHDMQWVLDVTLPSHIPFNYSAENREFVQEHFLRLAAISDS